MKRHLLCVALLCATTGFAVAAENPWVGTWKLDPAKSHFTGDTFTYSKTPKGMMHYSDGSTTSTTSASTARSTRHRTIAQSSGPPPVPERGTALLR